ncbi:MAG: cadmium-translocating P-type ATPase [Verrucomicrobia bacterium]|nr:cadmium-translocating P-type ATPase [Verrucomicrobiota bacterium]
MSDKHHHQAAEDHQSKGVELDGPKYTFVVSGMDCSEEVSAIETALKPLSGVRGVRADIVGSKVSVFHDGKAQEADLVRAINTTGVKVQTGEPSEKGTLTARTVFVAVSGVLTGIGMLLQWLGLKDSWAPDAAFLLAIVAGGWLVVFPKALRSIRSLRLDMNVLMVIAVTGAVAIGEHAEGAAIAFLFSLSELLESWSVGRARKAIQALMQLAPDVALVRRDGQTVEVPAADVQLEETIIVKSGQRVPLDGLVIKGKSAINQAPITGESMPVEKDRGDIVYAGTINGEGSLEIQTTKTAGDTTLARIIRMVEEAQGQKAPAQRFVDVFAKYYTPAVMVLALLIGLIPPLAFGAPWMDWIYRALVLLVIACPCALVISTPVSIVAGLTAMARRGVLIKGGAYLEALGSLRALAVDKTGTITEGKPRVIEVFSLGKTTDEELVRIAAAIDSHSTHPLAEAVVRYAEESNIEFPSAEDYAAKTGRGAEASIDGHQYFLGNHRFAHELGVCTPELEERLAKIEYQARSVVVVGHKPHADCAGEVLGVLAVGDAIRPDAKEAIKRIHAAGISKVIMLSGDNTRTAQAIALQAGIDEARGDLLPDDKIEVVKKLKSEIGHVAMIGDGVNDAPALAIADVGIAMGAAGTDTAIETADVALMRDDLLMVAEAILLGRRTLGVIRFNIAFSLVVKGIFLFLALLGHTSLWLAVLADTGATLLVVANALRLLRPARK